MVTVLVLRGNTVKIPLHPRLSIDTETKSTAEFRGPGVRHNFEDSGDDYDLDLPRSRGNGGRSGRIILLGDGTEVLTSADDTEMFDHDEDKDLESQVTKGLPKPGIVKSESRNGREDTPAPEGQRDGEKPRTPDSVEGGNPFDTPSSTTSEKSESTETAAPIIKAIPESALPTKLVNPPQEK